MENVRADIWARRSYQSVDKYFAKEVQGRSKEEVQMTVYKAMPPVICIYCENKWNSNRATNHRRPRTRARVHVTAVETKRTKLNSDRATNHRRSLKPIALDICLKTLLVLGARPVCLGLPVSTRPIKKFALVCRKSSKAPPSLKINLWQRQEIAVFFAYFHRPKLIFWINFSYRQKMQISWDLPSWHYYAHIFVYIFRAKKLQF